MPKWKNHFFLLSLSFWSLLAVVVVWLVWGGRFECQTNNTSRLICTFHAKWKMHFKIHKTNVLYFGSSNNIPLYHKKSRRGWARKADREIQSYRVSTKSWRKKLFTSILCKSDSTQPASRVAIIRVENVFRYTSFDNQRSTCLPMCYILHMHNIILGGKIGAVVVVMVVTVASTENGNKKIYVEYKGNYNNNSSSSSRSSSAANNNQPDISWKKKQQKTFSFK